MPNRAKCRTARNAKERANGGGQLHQHGRAPLPLASLARSLAFRAVRHFAPFGISRTLAFDALRRLALFGVWGRWCPEPFRSSLAAGTQSGSNGFDSRGITRKAE
jgi:hypothetical protein